MTVAEDWELFYKTGSVESYLKYCKSTRDTEKRDYEVYDRRTDNKRE